MPYADPAKRRAYQRDYQRRWARENRERRLAYERAWVEENREARRATNARYRKRHREKVNAANTLRRAIAAGKITRAPCEICGEPNAHGHHDDYSKPLDVRWLCSQHHAEVHRGA